MKKRIHTISAIAVILCLICCIALIQRDLTNKKDSSWFTERMSYLPQTEKIAPYLLGFTTTYASFLWIRCMLYFGEHYITDREFPWLVNMVDIVTKLNPYFYPAYEFGGLIIPSFGGNPDIARLILNRGINFIGKNNYKPAFYLGWLYYDKYKDKEMAAEYLAMAASYEKAPPYIAGLAATLYKDAGKSDMALGFLQSLYQTTENPAVKRTIEEKLSTISRDE